MLYLEKCPLCYNNYKWEDAFLAPVNTENTF